MSLPNDWFVNASDAGQEISQINRNYEEAAKIILEIARRLRLRRQQEQKSNLPMPDHAGSIPTHDGEIIDPPAPPLLPDGRSGEVIDIDPQAEIPVLELEIIPPRPLALPSIQQRPEQVVAQTVEQITNQMGTNGLYQSEAYTMTRQSLSQQIDLASGQAKLQAENMIYRLYDQEANELLAFRDAGPEQGYEIFTNELGTEDTKTLLHARLGIEKQNGIHNILDDPTFEKQINAMGDAAPKGAHAAYVAHYALDGYSGNTMKTPNYTLSRDAAGGLNIVQNPKRLQINAAGRKVIVTPKMAPMNDTPGTTDMNNNNGKVVLKTENGRVTHFNMSQQEQAGFVQLFRTAKQKPLAQTATQTAKQPKSELTR